MKFITLFISTALLLVCTVALAVFIIDPYGIWKTGIFTPTEFRGIVDRIYHPLRVATEDFDYVFLGSSRTREGYLPYQEHMNISAYNAAFSGGTTYESAKLMSIMARKDNPPGHVIVGLDFFGFGPELRLREGAEQGALNGTPLWKTKLSTLFGYDHILASIRTLKKNIAGTAEPPPLEFGSYYAGNHRELMKVSLKSHAETHLSKFDLNYTASDKTIMTAIRNGLTELAAKGTKVTLIINPVHASRMRLIQLMGLAPHYNLIMQELIEMVDEINSNFPDTIEFWDFGDCQPAVREDVPAEKMEHMSYFFDSEHFTPLLGADIAKQSFLRDQYPDYSPILRGKKLAPSPTNPTPFSRNWQACHSNIDAIVEETAAKTMEKLCTESPKWCTKKVQNENIKIHN